MAVIYTSQAKEDRIYWEKNNLKIIKRINLLIEDIKKHPFSGIGKPEPLKFERAGYWSRRINQEHRLVYKVDNGHVYIAQCRYHY
ncbi:MAG TPA: Txe/YoeB family addiction module toxin [Gammaproteobacteria bacterium]|nr:Txe/YoeB family addiction module toxin [Gammaproteobacteria bacterium]